MKRGFYTLLAALAGVLILFDVDFAPRFDGSRTEEQPDPQQERRFGECVESAEAQIHEETFANIDNPDVQREILYRRGQEARARCRNQYPQQLIAVEVPFDFNLVDLEWRFGATNEEGHE